MSLEFVAALYLFFARHWFSTYNLQCPAGRRTVEGAFANRLLTRPGAVAAAHAIFLARSR